MKNVISDIEIRDRKISSASEMAEAFNCHFANIGQDFFFFFFFFCNLFIFISPQTLQY